MKIEPRSLQQRTLIYILLPTFVLLLALSFIGFVFVRDLLISEWGTAAVSRLQRSADLIDARLREPKKLLLLLQQSDGSVLNPALANHIIRQIESLDDVVKVNIEWPGQHEHAEKGVEEFLERPRKKNRSFFLKKFQISSPQYDNGASSQTISMVSEFKGMDDVTEGRVEVILSFSSLIDQVINAQWWKGNKAYLLDGSNNVLVSTGDETGLEDDFPMRIFGTMNVLELDTLRAIEKSDSGTVFGPGKPPEEISGFYHLSEAPWTMVVIAPGDKVLQPFIQFRRFYSISFAVCIVFILIFIRMSMNRITTGIKQISLAADELAQGNFGPPLEVKTRDEVGELTGNFNKMTRQLKQRLELKEAINVAREVQQNLLPQEGFSSEGVEISGISIYCDETGGDYFDILKFSEDDGRVGVVVGDVVGHGIGAALLMTTVRALVRASVIRHGSPDILMDDVNSLLYQDTAKSGSFVTLFYLGIDFHGKSIRWVRAGHDPAMVINLNTGEFSELKGNGLALGIDPDWSYECNELPLNGEQYIILLSSDGALEAMNKNGEQFGKKRLQDVLTDNSSLHPSAIVQSIVDAVKSFTGTIPQADDITLAVVKIG
jgi:sigma-B regulation protein RsbU (phosphoserine phosphatase)